MCVCVVIFYLFYYIWSFWLDDITHELWRVTELKPTLWIFDDFSSPGVLGLWSARAEYGTCGAASSWFHPPLRAGAAAQAEQRYRQSDPTGPQRLTTACHHHRPRCHPGEWRLTHTSRYRHEEVCVCVWCSRELPGIFSFYLFMFIYLGHIFSDPILGMIVTQ